MELKLSGDSFFCFPMMAFLLAGSEGIALFFCAGACL
jgi:hypothetical protein